MNTRVYELAKQYDVSSKELVSLLQTAGYTVASHMSVLDTSALDFIKNHFEKGKKINTDQDVKKSTSKNSEQAIIQESTPSHEPKVQVTVTIQPQKIEAVEEISVQKKEEPLLQNQHVIPLEATTVGMLCERLEKPLNEVIIALLRMGVMASKNQLVSEEQVQKIAAHFGVAVKKIILSAETKQHTDHHDAVSLAALEERLPVVVVLGHVDHGKTTFLDYVRKTRLASKEKGGITQHIGAYEAMTKHGNIIFIDTPGHEAFSKIRQRGVRAADIAVLMIAADDGIKPQTVEAIKIIKEIKIPIVVALNKIDKAEKTRVETIKRQLAQYDILPEEWGGTTVCIPISAKTGEGVDSLLDMLVLQAQLMELRAVKNAPARGYVLESKLEKGRGPVATIICRQGSLAVGDYFTCGNTTGHVNSLVNSFGHHIKQVGPSIPVQVAGFSEAPALGDYFQVIPRQDFLKARSAQEKMKKGATVTRLGMENAINMIIKTDTDSSREALVDAIEKLEKHEKKGINIIAAGVGSINESDVIFAYDTDSIIMALHTKAEAKAMGLAVQKQVSISYFDIIYKLMEHLQEYIKTARQKLVITTKKIGEASVLRVFDIKNVGVIAGVYVKEGRFTRDGSVVVWRGKEKIGKGKIVSLQREKKAVKEVHAGFECGFVIEGFTDWQVDDRVECFLEQRSFE
ncbi:MAG TPA: translation initiation factor IF-2 [Candidatus Bathyarchaeia archaeon]|nr:translation initiation factor IF-2 [Candidatus Bathyarchaeia archaeon]